MSSDASRAYRPTWLAALLLYGAVAGGDFAYHLIGDLHTGDQVIEYSDVAVAFCAALFWPLDLIAMALLSVRQTAAAEHQPVMQPFTSNFQARAAIQ